MAVTAAYFGFLYGLLDELAKSRYSDAAPQTEKLILDHPGQHHVRAGIGPGDGWHRALLAQLGSPIMGWGLVANQPAFFLFAASEIVAIKIWAFNPGWCTHYLSVL